MSHVLANQYEKNKWKYQDNEGFIQDLIKTKMADQTRRTEDICAEVDRNEGRFRNEGSKISSDDEMSKASGKGSKLDSNADAKTAQGSVLTNNKTRESKLSEGKFESAIDDEYFQPEENGFIKLLGLPEISIETLFNSYKDKDKQT